MIRRLIRTTTMTKTARWTQLFPTPDAKAGSPCSRSSHGVSFVRGGSRLIVHGGEHIARTPLDPDQSTWAADAVKKDEWQWRLIPTPSEGGPCPRVAHSQAVVNDELVYVFGGRMGIGMGEKGRNDLWALDCSGDPGTETWSEVEVAGGSPPEARSFHKMIAVGTDLYVFGGCGASGRLADLHKFDTLSRSWTDLGKSELLRGRGGANLLHLREGNCLAVVAGFAGEESNDGHRFALGKDGGWEGSVMNGLEKVRPRSVCISAYLPSSKAAVIFGGEVDPSDRGHEGAGGFENDLLVLDGSNGAFKERIAPSINDAEWPEQRGWSDGDVLVESGTANEALYIFGGLSGDDKNPRRLDDMWRMTWV